MVARGPDRCLRVERVEHGLDQEDVGAAFDQSGDLLAVGLGELAERQGAVGRVFDSRRQRQRDVGRSECSGDPAVTAVACGDLVGRLPRQSGALGVEFVDQRGIVEAVLALGDRR